MRGWLRTWITPSRIALFGTIVVVLLLLAPIYTLGPGDHERRSCGNALVLDLERWRAPSLDARERSDHFERAYRSCTTVRVDRVAWAVGIATMTGLLVTVLMGTASGGRVGRRDGD